MGFEALRRPTVLCFGEILWDVLPHGRFAGGAPLNVAWQLRQLDVRPVLVSAVGRDADGDEMLRHLASGQLDSSGINCTKDLATGTVRATLSPQGDAHYEIATHVAWDRIVLQETTMRTARSAHAIVFGSLAQRSETNRQALDLLLQMLPISAQRVFDVNLRPPYDNLDLVRSLASRATLLKLNADEAARLCGDSCTSGREEEYARQLARDHGLDIVCVTCGSRGAGLLDHDQWFWENARPIEVSDTIGAGDAFLAGLLANLLHGSTSAVSLSRACRLGEEAASRAGASAGPCTSNGTTRTAFRK